MRVSVQYIFRLGYGFRCSTQMAVKNGYKIRFLTTEEALNVIFILVLTFLVMSTVKVPIL